MFVAFISIRQQMMVPINRGWVSKKGPYIRYMHMYGIMMCYRYLYLNWIRYVTYPLLTGIKVISKCLLHSYLSDNRWWSRSIGDGYLKKAHISDICMWLYWIMMCYRYLYLNWIIYVTYPLLTGIRSYQNVCCIHIYQTTDDGPGQ